MADRAKLLKKRDKLVAKLEALAEKAIQAREQLTLVEEALLHTPEEPPRA